MATKPWQPASLLHVEGRAPGKRYRWIRSDNLERAIAEGWNVLTSLNKGKENSPYVTLEDGTRIDGIIRKRNLILCWMPEDVAQQRDKYYTDMNKSLLDSNVARYNQEVTREGGKTYGEIVVNNLTGR